MFCKYCGQEVEEGSRFCSGCGNPITESQNHKDTQPDTTPPPLDPEQPQHEQELFFKLSRIRFCKNCGANIGKNKICPECRYKRNRGLDNFCTFCGATVEHSHCSSSKVSTTPSIAEKILRVISLCLVCFSWIGVLVHITSGALLPAIIILSITAFLCVFILPKKQIYKLKALMVKKHIKEIFILVVYILIIIAIILGIKIAAKTDNSLSGDDLAAYELISEVAYEFKNPSSVRIISGSVYYDEEENEYSGWFALSATNGYGATTVGYYFVSYLDGEIFALDLEEVDSGSVSLAKERDELNVDRINKALDKKWGKN